MYNSKYADNMDAVGSEEGSDAQDLQNLLQEVKDLYNSKYPLDQVDDLDNQLEYDEDGVLWVKAVGEQDEADKTQQLECLLDEVKGVYNLKFSFDDVDETACEVECDADGLAWETYTGPSMVDNLQSLLDDVKNAYNERYPCDSIEEDNGDIEGLFNLLAEVKGLYSAKYMPDKVEELEDMLEEVKVMYTDKYRETMTSELWESLEEVKAMYKSKYSEEGSDAQDLQNLLQEVKDLYNSKYPLDQVDDLDNQLEYDEDGVLWATAVGEQDEADKTQQLECLLDEVKGLYN